jgi:hypothetical protein
LNLQLTQPSAEVRLLVLPRAQYPQRERRQGAAEIRAGDRSLVRFHRLGMGTAEFVIGRNRGVYIGAIGEMDAGTAR